MRPRVLRSIPALAGLVIIAAGTRGDDPSAKEPEAPKG
jgi:hypothetical protein